MKRPFIRITFVIIALAAAAAVVIGDLARYAAGRKLRETILAALQPRALTHCACTGFAPRSPRRAPGFNSTDRNGAARLRRFEDCRGAPEAEAELLSREPPLQQLVVHAKGGAAPCVGVPGALGEQAHRPTRSGSASPRTDEPAECA